MSRNDLQHFFMCVLNKQFSADIDLLNEICTVFHCPMWPQKSWIKSPNHDTACTLATHIPATVTVFLPPLQMTFFIGLAITWGAL